MKNLLPIVGVAFVLSLAGTTAYAADHQRGDHRGNRDAVTHHDDNDRADRRGDRNQRNRVIPPQQHNWQPKVNNNNNQFNWQNNNANRFQTDNRWRNNNNVRGNFNRFRQNLRSPQHFRLGRYQAPRNYNYRRWSFGERLPFSYFARNYWLTNAIVYGLFAPPPGLIWVRYGPDALLVDQYTGEIVQVRYGVFYG